MDFVRKHLFYVVLAAVVVVVGAVEVVLYLGAAGDVEEQIEAREQVASKISSLARGPKVNKAYIDALSSGVSSVREQVSAVEARCLAWNYGEDYRKLMIESDTGEKAFPIDNERYYGLAQYFRANYRERFLGLLDPLKKTAPLTQEVVQGMADAQMEALKQQLRRQRIEAGAAADTVDVDETGLRARAETWAREQAAIRSARAGQVYVDEAALTPAFPLVGEFVREDELWEGQLQLWVVSDIVSAIGQTNRDVYQERGLSEPAEQNVINSAVKRIHQIVVDRDYFSARGVGRGGQGAAATLTQRASNALHDVLHYRVRMTMPTRYLDRFIRNLEQQNFHTVLRVAQEPAPTEEGYYYGGEPVSLIDLTGEILLLTDWSRGRYLEKERKWSEQYPPLIPARKLDRMDERGIPMRPADQRRVDELEGRTGGGVRSGVRGEDFREGRR